MMKKKGHALLAVLCLALTVCGFGCRDNGGGETDIDLNVDKNIEATLRIAVKNDKAEISAMEKVMEAFGEDYPNVKYDLVPITDYEATIMGDVASGLTYDVMWAADAYVTLFADEGLLLNLDTFIEQADFDRSLYYESLIKLGQYKHDGAQYFLPRDYSKIVVYLNKKIFDQYGVPLPSDDWTWEEYTSVCRQLYDAGCNFQTNSQYVMEAEFDWRIQMYGITSSFGGRFIGSDGSPILDENFQRGLSEMQNLIKNGYAKFSKTEQSNFASGRVAMRWQVRPAGVSYRATLGEDLAVVAFPSIESGVEGAAPSCGTGTTGYGIGRTSENKALAWKFIEYMMSLEGQEMLSRSGLVVPSLISLAEREDASWKSAVPGLDGDAFVYAGTRDVIPDYYDSLSSVYMSGYDSAVVNLLHGIFSDTGKGIRGAVNTCKLEINTFISQQG